VWILNDRCVPAPQRELQRLADTTKFGEAEMSKKSKSVPAKDTSSHLATALRYGEHGLLVVPLHGLKDGRCTCDEDCKQPGRHPRTPNGIEDATGKPDEIKKFWSQWPKAKIAIATGAPDIIALTVTGNDGRSALKKHGTLKKTVKFRADDSRTYLLKAPIDAIPDGTVGIAKGIIVHGRGEYVIAPNDLKVAEGRHFVAGHRIGQTDIAPAPDWLLTLIGRRLKGSSAKPQTTTSWNGVTFNTRAIDVDWIADGGDPCDPKKVKLLAQSYTVTGPRTPPVVRLLDHAQRSPGKNMPEYALLSDRHQIEALKSLGARTIDCIVADADDTDACLWQGAELFHRPEATFLDRAEVAVNCLRRIRIKAGQTPTLGGRRQPHDKGYSAAEKLLGVSRRDLRRLEKIAEMCPEAKKEARRAKLDDVLNALLEIADEPAERQVNKVLELAERYAERRRKPSAPEKSKKAARSSAAAATKKKGVDTKENPDEAETDAERSSNASTEEVEDDADDAEAEGSSTTDDAEDDAEDSQAGAESPPTAPEDDGDIPATFKRKGDAEMKETLLAIYDNHLAPNWPHASYVVQHWFVTELLRMPILQLGKKEQSR
jgi:hypothetical protein